MKFKLFFIVFFALLLRPYLSNAAVVDINTTMLTDQYQGSSNSSISRTMYDASVGFAVDKKNTVLLSFAFGSVATSDSTSSTATYTGTDMGIRITYLPTRSKSWTIATTYNFQSRASYNSGTTTTEQRGTSLKFDIGYNYWLGEYFAICGRINYYQATLTEEITNSTSLATVAYSRTQLYPGIGLFYLY